MSPAALSATLAVCLAAVAHSAEVTCQSTTIGQFWRKAVTGKKDEIISPFTQFLDVNVTKLGRENLSFAFYGWGQKELGTEASNQDGKMRNGEIITGYLRYHFNKANGEMMAGRFYAYETGNVEQVDGIYGRADLVGNLNISTFFGKPSHDFQDKANKRTMLFGSRLGAQLAKKGEIGLSVLLDGPRVKEDVKKAIFPSRRLVNMDLHLVPALAWDITGKTSYHLDIKEMAEQDLAIRYRISPLYSVTGQYINRKFRSYYAGTSLPNAFRQDTGDAQISYGAKVQVGKMGGPAELVADYKRMQRENFGRSDRMGAELRLLHNKGMALRYGLGYHRTIAGPSRMIPSVKQAYATLSHHECRVFAYADWDKVFAALDAVYHRYDDKTSTVLNGRPNVYEYMASLGWRPKDNFIISGDLLYGANPDFERELRGAVRVEYRFGSAQ